MNKRTLKDTFNKKGQFMKPSDYIKNVLRSESHIFNVPSERLLHAAMGCGTEAGEILDVLKKALFYGKSITKWALTEEIGDMLWYLGIFCDELNVSFEELMEMNIKKLKNRYPEKFTIQDAQKRDYKAEEEAAHS